MLVRGKVLQRVSFGRHTLDMAIEHNLDRIAGNAGNSEFKFGNEGEEYLCVDQSAR